jgi:hypothetical protein
MAPGLETIKDIVPRKTTITHMTSEGQIIGVPTTGIINVSHIIKPGAGSVGVVVVLGGLIGQGTGNKQLIGAVKGVAQGALNTANLPIHLPPVAPKILHFPRERVILYPTLNRVYLR